MVHNCFTDRDFIYKFEEYSIKIIYKIIEKGKFYLWFPPRYITNTARSLHDFASRLFKCSTES